ncbi:MAG: DNA polymerase IV [Rhodobacteraceae bacterium]|nr:DNA polymerase IV [Paracoccaceae bacterium]
MPSLCRDCLHSFETGPRCPACRSPRVLAHPELFDLAIAHIDCDAFYAAVEKRDRPELADRPVIIGGGRRGVVSTACYVARIHGVRSAMPMFEALRLCPEAVVIRPRMEVYASLSRRIRDMMEELTPAVEPLSLDEAFLDLTGTARLHGAPPAILLARLARRMRRELGITASVGLSHNKFLAKIASDRDKPDGFSVIGRAETPDFLAGQPARIIWGIGAAGQAQLAAHGIRKVGDLLRWDRRELVRVFGKTGLRLWHLARGEDRRRVAPDAPVKSVSNETTFAEDIDAPDLLDGHVWRLSEKVSDRLKARGLAGGSVTLKLKRADHRLFTRSLTLPDPTQLAERIHAAAAGLQSASGLAGPFRLIGVGVSALVPEAEGDRLDDLLDPEGRRRRAAEAARDAIRRRFGSDAIIKGRALR